MPSLRSVLRGALVLAALAALGAIVYFAWFRDSSLVAVRDVKVEGVESSDRGQVVSALTRAAEGMTTLHVQTDRLSDAVSDQPTVASVSADPSLPHGLTIDVTEYRPALIAVDGDRKVPAAADGSLLPGARVTGPLPVLPVASLPDSGRLGGKALVEALTVGAAPDPLRPLIEGTTVDDTYGVVIIMRGGIQLRFGNDGNRKAQWAAAAAVLADPSLDALTYVDLRVPERPAVGGTSTPSAESTPVTPTLTTPTPSAPVTTVP